MSHNSIVKVYDPEEAPVSTDSGTDWNGFRQWRYTNNNYLNLMQAHPALMGALENSIDQSDWVAATALWARLSAMGAISYELVVELASAAIAYNLPTEIQQVLDSDSKQPP